MKFTYYDLGNCKAGQIVEVTLSGSAANVQLVDSNNFVNYKNGRNYRYAGGLATKSPVRLAIPNSGHWYIVIDMRGLTGTVNFSCKILPGPLPVIKQAPLSSIPSLISGNPYANSDDFNPEYDVFISHASEDKDDVVRPLAVQLSEKGLKVWYDEFEMRIGDSLRRKIDSGLRNSRFGIVVLSKSFFKKGWTNYELDGIVSKANSGEQILLPIWHNITKQDVLNYSPSIADRLARNTTAYTIEEIASEIADLIKSK
ncbi:MAG: DUF1883 domain-containing protein [Desulfuromonadaceae bacterium]|nr:DUF1883 domain-containing protein [Desulfuromonadaceae bacterium]